MLIRVLTVIALLFLLGCESQLTRVEPVQKSAAPATQQAQMVFMRSSVVASGVGASIYEVKDGEIIFIGKLANETKIAHTAAPGKHIFMVVSETADFIEADLQAGKSYYGVVVPQMGVWNARFSLWPVQRNEKSEYHIDSPQVRAWLSGTKAVVNSDQSQAWYRDNKQAVKEKYQQYWPQWQSKNPQQRAQKTLLPTDGI